MRFLSSLLAILLLPTSLLAQADVPQKVREYRQANEHRIFKEFIDLLSLPNVAADGPNIRKNAQLIVEMMKRRGLNPRLLEAKSPGVPPAVYGEWITPGATRTLVLYAHYDGQPTDPKQWTGTQPWQPALRSASLEAGGKLLP